MKSFSPAGMADKGFYGGPGWPQGGDPGSAGRSGQGFGGPGPGGGYSFALFGTFGNPDGATSGGGAFALGGDNPDGPNQGGGAGGLVPLTWVQRTSPTVAPINAMASNGAGTAMLVTNAGAASISTDGGHTWGALLPITGAAQAAFGLDFGQGGAWITASAEFNGATRRSTNNGATWALIDTATGDLGVALVTDGAGRWLYLGQNGALAVSTDNGLTWPTRSTPVSGWLGPFALWHGGQFVLLGQDLAFNPVVVTTPDGITLTPFIVTNNIPGGLCFGNGQYVLGVPGGIRHDAVAGNLATNPDILIANLNQVSVTLAGGGRYVALDGNAGDVANSLDADTWVAGTIPIFGTQCGVYDATHDSFIVGTNLGELATQP